MSFVETPPQKPGDDLDGWLRAFFQSRLPQRWPSPPVPAAHATPDGHATNRSLMRGRWTLAASVALLWLGSWLLPSRFPPDAKPENSLGAPAISDNNLRREMEKEHKRHEGEHKNRPGLAAEENDPIPEGEEADLPFLR